MLKYIIIAVAIVAVLACGSFGVSAIVYYAIFGKRSDKNPYFKYFTAEEKGVKEDKTSAYYNGVELDGSIYHTKPIEECEKVVLFAHGMGPGRSAYTTEISYYANQGYAVFACDNYGCDRSEGKNILGFYAGVEAVVSAYIAIKSDERLKNKPVILVGHSWGAYSVLCATERISVEGVVAISAFDEPVHAFREMAKTTANSCVALIVSWGFAVLNFFKFGKNGNKNAVKCIEKSGVPCLMIWGEKDPVVVKEISATCLANGYNIQKIIDKNKKHNPYNTVSAEEKLAELLSFKSESEEEKIKFYKDFDFVKATEEDEEIMQATAKFIGDL